VFTRNLALLFLALFFSLFHLSVQAEQSLQREDGSTITYYLRAQGKDTLYVLVQGSDCNSVFHDAQINQQFGLIASDADILTVEKYGITQDLKWDAAMPRPDCPAAYIQHDSPRQRAQDYIDVISQLVTRMQYKKVLMLGGREGALVANLVASQTDLIDLVVALNGGARYFFEDVLFSLKADLPPEAYLAAEMHFTAFTEAVIESNAGDLQASGHGLKWWKDMLSLDQTALINEIDVPLLLIQSGADRKVDPRAAEKQAKRLMKYKDNVQFRLYPDIDHALNDLQGNSKSGEVAQDIKQWLAGLSIQ